jgi:hypothetical protein
MKNVHTVLKEMPIEKLYACWQSAKTQTMRADAPILQLVADINQMIDRKEIFTDIPHKYYSIGSLLTTLAYHVAERHWAKYEAEAAEKVPEKQLPSEQEIVDRCNSLIGQTILDVAHWIENAGTPTERRGYRLYMEALTLDIDEDAIVEVDQC